MMQVDGPLAVGPADAQARMPGHVGQLLLQLAAGVTGLGKSRAEYGGKRYLLLHALVQNSWHQTVVDHYQGQVDFIGDVGQAGITTMSGNLGVFGIDRINLPAVAVPGQIMQGFAVDGGNIQRSPDDGNTTRIEIGA